VSKSALFIITVTAFAVGAFAESGGAQNPSSVGPQQQMDLNLVRGRVGALRIGMTADEVVRLFGRQRVKRVDLRLEGMPAPALEIRLGGSSGARPSLIAELAHTDNRVWRVKVFDQRFRTARGLGVGSTVAEIRTHHKVQTVTGEGTNGVYVEELRMTFDFGWALPDFPRIPASARVQSVLVLPAAIPK
jgi:hypothetical protein